MFDSEHRNGSVEEFLGFTVRINDGPNYYMLYKDIFVRGIYDFESTTSEPRILDCGSNIGMSVLYFKHRYPKARITAFEPDPAVLPYLKENIEQNNLDDVTVEAAAVSSDVKDMAFVADGKYSSSLTQYATSTIREATSIKVRCVRLCDYLNEPVDFLKMNIEGAEADVLLDCASTLRQVQCLAFEYHHLPGLPRRLHEILSLLDSQGFDYLIHTYDAETNPGCQPPFRLSKDSQHYLLVHARRRD